MLTRKQIPALYNGVSQQSPTMRMSSQCAAMENAWATPVDGLRKRPPTQYRGAIYGASALTPPSLHIHLINRDLVEQYLVVIHDGGLKVTDLEGNAYTVTFPNGDDYLDVIGGTSVEDSFAVVTVADYSFIVNKTKTVALGALGDDTIADSTNAYSLSRYQPDGAEGGAQQLQYDPNPAGGIYRGVVQAFQDLPAIADSAEGDIWMIRGTSSSGFASYYVRRMDGVWGETVAPGQYNAIDPTTMPHALIRKLDGTFEFAPFSWAPRRVGDEQSNPHPTFVGRKIKDVFFYRNRLGMVVDENIITSRAGDFGNYYRLTVVDLLADEVIDTATTETKVTKLNHVVPFGGTLMAFSDQVQFRLKETDVLSPYTAALEPVTQYHMTVAVRPQPLGSDIYFASENGEWVTIREYYAKADTNGAEAADITGHVPRYIPAGVRDLFAAPDHDAVFVLTRGAPTACFVYKFYWVSETEKAQSAWHRWDFEGSNLLKGEVIGNYLYLILRRSKPQGEGSVDGVYIERMSLDLAAVTGNLDHDLLIDRRVLTIGEATGVSSVRFQIPWVLTEGNTHKMRLFVTATGEALPLTNATINLSTGNVTFPSAGPGGINEGLIGKQVYAGIRYDMRYTFSEPFITGRDGAPITSGRLQVRSYNVYYTDAGQFGTEVAPYGTYGETEVVSVIPAAEAAFELKTGDYLDTWHLSHTPEFLKGTYTFQVYGDARQAVVSLTNDSHLQATFNAAEVELFYQNRSGVSG